MEVAANQGSESLFCSVIIANANAFRLGTLRLFSVSLQVKGQIGILESGVNFLISSRQNWGPPPAVGRTAGVRSGYSGPDS